MKRLSLICIAALTCYSLAGCGTTQSKATKSSSEVSSLKAENSSLKAKRHQTHKKAKKARKTDKQITKSSKSSSARSESSKSSNNNTNATNAKANGKRSKNGHQPTDSEITSSRSTGDIPQSYKDNMARGLEWNGTRPRSSFSSEDQFLRYNAWHQGLNYDPSTNTYTQMNQQQLDDMRQQMNKDGGQSFR